MAAPDLNPRAWRRGPGRGFFYNLGGMEPSGPSKTAIPPWSSTVPPKRWWGFRRDKPAVAAFSSLEDFVIAQQSELYASLPVHERAALGRLLSRGQKIEIEVFLRTHGANPLFDPQAELDFPVGVAKADMVDLLKPPSREALAAILDGRVIHVLFQAGEASRFGQGPFYTLKPTDVARTQATSDASLPPLLEQADQKSALLPPALREFFMSGELGPKQSVLIRAALRRAVEWEIQLGFLKRAQAEARYAAAVRVQKLIYFVNRHQSVHLLHDETLRQRFSFFGFDPRLVVTIEQELVPGIRLDEEGNIFLREEEEAKDAAGHLYAMIQAARPGNFTCYDESGRPGKLSGEDAFGYLAELGGRFLNIIRINDMDRHSVEIINPRSLTFALDLFSRGYVNAIEAVSNPTGQKGGTGTVFGDPETHILTETHENTFPSLSRALESAMKTYLEKNKGQNPAYNAMRQWSDLAATRSALHEFGGRIVFVPRRKNLNGLAEWYIGVDMPMGDLSLLGPRYRSRMFQFVGPDGRQLAIHDMKQLDQLNLYMRTLIRQLEDPFVLAAAREVVMKESVSFDAPAAPDALYGAPAPELQA